MAPPNQLTPAKDFDIEEMLVEAQHRWLRTPEICEILRNYKCFNIAPEPPNMPPSGSLFLFDRKVLRYFRKDGHRWRKKKDGKTIREAHERLKAGSIDVLHCYYAHGEDNENFQRRSYWMLEEKLSHIVLVHYRNVKGYKTNFNHFKETEEAIAFAPETEQGVCHSEAENSISLGLQQDSCQATFHNTISRISNGAQASDYEDAESGNFLAKSAAVSSLEIDEDQLLQKHREEFESWERDDALESRDIRVQSASVKPSLFDVQSYSLHDISKQENVLAMHLLTDPVCGSQASRDLVQGLKNQQVSGEESKHFGSACKISDTIMPNIHDHAIINSLRLDRQNLDTMDHLENQPSFSACLEGQPDIESNLTVVKKSSHFSASRTLLKRPVKDEDLKKCDSFSRWACKDVGDVDPVVLSSGSCWDADDKRSDRSILLPVAEIDSYTHGPSLSQGQLFRIIDFAPNWGYANSETKVLITGEFVTTQPDTRKYHWSCMFGELEVPAEVIADGVLRCYAPPHGVARVHFYVTCSNRIACSDVREFEYRDKFTNSFDSTSLSNNCDALQVRLCKLLSLSSIRRQNTQPCHGPSSSDLHHEISLLFKGIGSEWFQILELTSKDKFLDEVKDKLAVKFVKEKLYEWLQFEEAEGGSGLRGLDENGQGVVHLAAALGYDWAISPLVVAGVSINFRDIRGWTALHWAACYGRERTVAYLISLGAYAGALTDPTPTNPMGRTSADLASEHGHKGISGFLAESALSAHLESLTLKDKAKHNSPVEPYEMETVSTASKRMATPVSGGDNIDGLSLKDSLAALCNATQAAARIHQVYRSLSLRKKQVSEFESDKIKSSDEYALSVITLNTRKQGQHDEPVHAAAVRIQNKFRSWKGRREFLKLRKKIVQIQAHIKGHQVRKHYKTFVWSVGIVEKVILRWRRRRSGLRGFKSEYLTVKSHSEGTSLKDDYDYLKQGRKQAEERLQKALTRVKSMVRYPEAREQYRRLLTIVREIKEMKDGCSGAINGTLATVLMEDDLIDLDTLLNGGINQ